MKRKEYKQRDTNNSADDEFGFNYNISDNKPKKKAKKKKKPKEKFNHFKGLGGGSSSRGPWLK
jgi:hypothetical protein